jgi:hypothetical protein
MMRVPTILLQNALPNVELLPRLAEHTFLESIREVTLSGFALELYSADERPSAYWYASKVMSADYDTLDILLGVAANSEVLHVHVTNELMMAV